MELNVTFNSSEDRVIFAHAHVFTRPEFCAALTHNNVTRDDKLATVLFSHQGDDQLSRDRCGMSRLLFYVPFGLSLTFCQLDGLCDPVFTTHTTFERQFLFNSFHVRICPCRDLRECCDAFCVQLAYDDGTNTRDGGQIVAFRLGGFLCGLGLFCLWQRRLSAFASAFGAAPDSASLAGFSALTGLFLPAFLTGASTADAPVIAATAAADTDPVPIAAATPDLPAPDARMSVILTKVSF